jgi:FtsP/CotA-like multicopper oxidase with cupredoxin domain
MNTTAYDAAFAGAQPAAGGRVVRALLEARESEWEFVPGRKTRVWAYNGQVPGPVLEASVGDVLEVTLVNRLNEPTTIHWHGLRLGAPMDGTQEVQPTVAPGESFVYRFSLPDAGTFWYHPHFDETSQLERGLYGAIVVRGMGGPRFDSERVVVLDDVKLDRQSQIAPIGGFVENHDGRQGQTLLVNGRATPALEMNGGQMERWRLVNASSARYHRLSFEGRLFMQIASDGGLLPERTAIRELLLAPGERADIAVGPFAPGEMVRLESLPYNRRTIARTRRELIASVRVGAARPSVTVLPRRQRDIAPLASADASPTREVHFGVRPSLRSGVKFVVNGKSHAHDSPVKVGDLQVWDVINDTLMDHPFHLHGFFFQVLSVNGAPPAHVSWEDTVNLPPRSRVRIAWLPDDRPGSWMYHCHILEHHASGMMAHFEVKR